MTQYKYEEKSLLGGWIIEVKNGIQCLKPIEQKKFQGKYIVLISPISNVNEIYLQRT